MNRHHPYNASFEYPNQIRRGGYSPAHGERGSGHRFSDRGGHRGRGGNRGRGSYPNHDFGMSHPSPYDQGYKQTDLGEYARYEPPPEPYYQNGYGNSTPTHFSQPQGGYDQNYPKYEVQRSYDEQSMSDGPRYDNEDDRANVRRPFGKDREDKVHDSIIEERIQRERPCRTLFIRNIKYETPSDEVRKIFEEHGDIKTFFDLIATRGMVFVTYHDIRAAERARDRLQGSEINGRPIDVHYSLPRDDQKGDKNQMQGTLQVTLRGSQSGHIDDNELRRRFQQYGDVKTIMPVNDRFDSRYVEFYDLRACSEAHSHLNHQALSDGVMDIVFGWDNSEPEGNPRDGSREWEDRGHRGGGRGRGRGRPRGRGYDDHDDRRGGGGGEYSRPERESRGGRGGRYDDPGRGGRVGGYPDRYNDDRGGYGDGYGGPGLLGPPPSYGMPPVPAHGGPPPAGMPDERLEQARKVQQLLAALKQPPATGTSPMPSVPPTSLPPAPTPYYPPPAGYGAPPPPNPYMPQPLASGPPPSSHAPQLNNPALAGLPPNILALLQSSQGQPPAQPPSQPSYGGLPPASALSSSSQNTNNPQYHQLMSYLQSQAKP